MLCPLPQTALTSTSVSPSSALPGDALNSVVDPSFSGSPPALAAAEPSSVSFSHSPQKLCFPESAAGAVVEFSPDRVSLRLPLQDGAERGSFPSDPSWRDSYSDHLSVSVQIEMTLTGPRGHVGAETSTAGAVAPPAGRSGSGQGPMLQFFTKLRRHASLEGASPYFKIKKWKLDSSQRASSLDTRGNDPADPQRIKPDPQAVAYGKS